MTANIANTMLVSIAAIAAGAIATTKSYAADFEFAYAHYELETAGGRAALFGRLDRKIDGYCREDEARFFAEKRAAAACKAAILPQAVSEIGDPRLSMLFVGAQTQLARR